MPAKRYLKGTKLIIILDNVSFHNKEDIINKIAPEMPNLILEFFPPAKPSASSRLAVIAPTELRPDYNIAELVWHSGKEDLAHHLFKSVEQLESLLHKLLNEGELIIKWGRKLKNKGNAVNAI